MEVKEIKLEVQEEKLEVKKEQLEVKEQLGVKEEQLEVKLTEDVKVKDEKKEEEELKSTFEQETVVEKEGKEQNKDKNALELEVKKLSVFQESQIEDNFKKNVYEDLEIPDNMEVIQITEVLSPKLIDEPIVEDVIPSLSTPITQEIVPDEIKPKSPSPVSTMTCSIDGNTDTEWNVPVAPATGTIKINISQKFTPVKPIITSESTSIELPRSPPDFTPTFGEIDPDQPPPPGLEMETVVVPKIQREMKPRLITNAKKLKEYPVVNKGKEMSGLCSIM